MATVRHPKFTGSLSQRKTKWCPRCSHDVLLVNFHKNRSNVDGYAPYCKVCARSIQKEVQQRKKARQEGDKSLLNVSVLDDCNAINADFELTIGNE